MNTSRKITAALAAFIAAVITGGAFFITMVVAIFTSSSGNAACNPPNMSASPSLSASASASGASTSGTSASPTPSIDPSAPTEPDTAAPSPSGSPSATDPNYVPRPGLGQVVSVLPSSVAGYSGQQLLNAAAIIKAGQAQNLDARTITLAVTAAMDESSLLNVNHGDAARSDTIGLFQEGPERGPADQRLDPTGAANIFYSYLTKVPNYLQMQPTLAIHAAQSNADPYAYTKYWAPAGQVVSALTSDPSLLDKLGTPDINLCLYATGNSSGGPVDAAALLSGVPRANPRTPEQAIAWAELQATSHSTGWYEGCLRFVANTYGWNAAGVTYAIDLYNDYIPATMHHDGDLNAPAGALMFWTTAHRPGHIALSAGNGMVISTDILVNDQASLVPAKLIADKWGAHYVGWAPPYFPAAA